MKDRCSLKSSSRVFFGIFLFGVVISQHVLPRDLLAKKLVAENLLANNSRHDSQNSNLSQSVLGQARPSPSSGTRSLSQSADDLLANFSKNLLCSGWQDQLLDDVFQYALLARGRSHSVILAALDGGKIAYSSREFLSKKNPEELQKDVQNAYFPLLLLVQQLEARAFANYQNHLKKSGPLSYADFLNQLRAGRVTITNSKKGDFMEELRSHLRKIQSRFVEAGFDECQSENFYVYQDGQADHRVSHPGLPRFSIFHELPEEYKVKKENVVARVIRRVVRPRSPSPATRIEPKEVQVGATFYYRVDEDSERLAGLPRNHCLHVKNYSGQVCVSGELAGELAIQGTAILSRSRSGELRGKTVNFSHSERETITTADGEKKVVTKKIYVLTESAYGLGNTGDPLIPFRSVALDPDYYDYENGQSIFIPSTVGLKIPGTNQVHDGVWVVHDIGGAIEGARIDLYTGDMHWRTALGYFKNKDNFVSPEEALQNRPELQQLIEQRQHFSERSRLGDPKLLVDLFFI